MCGCTSSEQSLRLFEETTPAFLRLNGLGDNPINCDAKFDRDVAVTADFSQETLPGVVL